jgi:hypothetical protein
MTEQEIDYEPYGIQTIQSWTLEDILYIRPTWTPKRAKVFLDSHYDTINYDVQEAGLKAIEALLKEEE